MNDASHDASKDLEQRQSVFEAFSTTMPKLVALLEKVQAQKVIIHELHTGVN